MANESNIFEAKRTDADFAVDGFTPDTWDAARAISISRYWSGEAAPAHRHATARALWSQNYLYLRFDCEQGEPLVINVTPSIESKPLGLWRGDVCEIFIAPNVDARQWYYEFEVSPTGVWLDLLVYNRNRFLSRNWSYRSGMEAASRVLDARVTMQMRVPFVQGFRRMPDANEEWLVNLFRCVGSTDLRGYLTWQPTGTKTPNFHTPAAFGRLRFVA